MKRNTDPSARKGNTYAARAARAVAVLGLAATSACSIGGPFKPDGEVYRDGFKHLQPTTELVAVPVVVTEKARQRETAQSVVYGENFTPDDIDTSAAANARDARANIRKKISIPEVRKEADRLLDSEISDDIENVPLFFDRDYLPMPVKDVLEENKNTIENTRAVIEQIKDKAVRNSANLRFDLEIATGVLDSQPVGKMNTLSRLASAAMPYIQERSYTEYVVDATKPNNNADKADAMRSKLSEKMDTKQTYLTDEIYAQTRLDTTEGDKDKALEVNKEARQYRKALKGSTDPGLPAAKSLVYEQLPTVSTLNADQQKVIKKSRVVIEKTPKKYAELELQAEKAIDENVRNVVIDNGENYGTSFADTLITELDADSETAATLLKHIRATIEAMTDPVMRKEALKGFDLQLAQVFKDDEWFERTPELDQIVLKAIEDAKIKAMAQAARGGDKAMARGLDRQLGALNNRLPITDVWEAKLFNGSNKQAEEINKKASDYLLYQ